MGTGSPVPIAVFGSGRREARLLVDRHRGGMARRPGRRRWHGLGDPRAARPARRRHRPAGQTTLPAPILSDDDGPILLRRRWLEASAPRHRAALTVAPRAPRARRPAV